MTAQADNGSADGLDWLPEPAVRAGLALQPVLQAFGRNEPLAELARHAAGFVADPPVVAISAVAAAYGLKPRVEHLASAELTAVTAPCVLLVDGEPRAVLPGTTPASLPTASSTPSTAGMPVITFTAGREFRRGEQATSTTALLGRRLRPARSGLALAVAAGVLLALPSIVVAGLAKTFVNKYLIDGSVQWLTAVLIAVFLAAVLQVGLSALQQAAMTRCSRKMSITVSADYLWHLLRLPISHFVARPAGDLGFLMNLNDKTATALGRRLVMALMSVVIGSITGVFLARFSGWLTLVILGLTALSIVAVQLLSKRLAPLSRDLSTAQAAMFGTATGGISSIESLKANGAEEALFSRWAHTYNRTLVIDQRMGVINAVVNAVPNLSVLLMTTAVIGIGGAQVMGGSITLGDLVGFQSLLVPFLTANAVVLNSSALLQKVVSDSRNLDETDRLPIDPGLAAADTMPEVDGAAKLAGALEVRGLRFGYQPGGPALIDGLDLRLEPGTRVALVGGSGSGKSTVARLVTGQLEAWGGQILFDGRPRHEHSPAVLAQSVAFVQQEVYLFDGTVTDNLTLWDPTVPDADVVRAAQDACIHDEVSAFPGGYSARILEGGRNLSGGQRQRIEIARALAGNPHLLVLDEATSALDSVTEGVVDANLRRRGCTCLIVAHRLSTIRDCDEIILLTAAGSSSAGPTTPCCRPTARTPVWSGTCRNDRPGADGRRRPGQRQRPGVAGRRGPGLGCHPGTGADLRHRRDHRHGCRLGRSPTHRPGRTAPRPRGR
jgi:ATP-binding cassette subfamily C protein